MRLFFVVWMISDKYCVLLDGTIPTIPTQYLHGQNTQNSVASFLVA
jgi:hypothetical protein